MEQRAKWEVVSYRLLGLALREVIDISIDWKGQSKLGQQGPKLLDMRYFFVVGYE